MGDQIKFYNNIHSYSQLILLPWGWGYDLPDNIDDLTRMANLGHDALKAVHYMYALPCKWRHSRLDPRRSWDSIQLWNGVEGHRQLWFYPAPRTNNSKWRRSLGFPYDCGQADHPGVCYAIVSSFSRIQLQTNVCSCCGINQFGIIQFDQ